MTEACKIVGDMKIRYDWYQTETHVALLILQKGVEADKLKVKPSKQELVILLPNLETALTFKLAYDVNPAGIQIKVTSSKVEIKLPKIEFRRWESLEADPAKTSHKQSKNWDTVVKDEEVEETDPMNELFRKIYSEGTDEVKKAMNKSFTESGGTVLSTNWNEVGTDKVDIKPPDGMEWKKWD